MKTEPNKHGLTRYIPKPIERAVRIKSGFGCVICGKAICQYHHVEPEFEDAKDHNGIITLLCGSCHDKAHSTFSKQKVLEAINNPKCKQDGFTQEELDIDKENVKIRFGNCEFKDTFSLIAINGESILTILPPGIEGEPFKLNAFFTNNLGEPIFQVVDNIWSGNIENWDIECVSTEIIIRQKKGKIALRLENIPRDILIVHQIDMKYKGYHIEGNNKGIKISTPSNKVIFTLSNGATITGQIPLNIVEEHLELHHLTIEEGDIDLSNSNVSQSTFIGGGTITLGGVNEDVESDISKKVDYCKNPFIENTGITILPIESFKILNYFIRKINGIPFPPIRVFHEFYSFIASFILSDKLAYTNMGNFENEWKTGELFPGKRDFIDIHPYDCFHNLDFIIPAGFFPFPISEELNIISTINTPQTDIILNELFPNEKNHNITIGSNLRLFHQSYNGLYGIVRTRLTPILKEYLPKVIKFESANKVVASDSNIKEAVKLLEINYKEKFSYIREIKLNEIFVPSFLYELLDNIPESTVEPTIFISEMLKLRDKYSEFKKLINYYEVAFYDERVDLKNLLLLKTEIEKETHKFSNSKTLTNNDRLSYWFYIDDLSFVVKCLVKSGVSLNEINSLLKHLIPNISNRIMVNTPSFSYEFDVKSNKLQDFNNLVGKKLLIKFA